MVLVCHVISQDPMIKKSCDFMGSNPSSYVNIMPSFLAIWRYVFSLSCDFAGGSPSW